MLQSFDRTGVAYLLVVGRQVLTCGYQCPFATLSGHASSFLSVGQLSTYANCAATPPRFRATLLANWVKV